MSTICRDCEAIVVAWAAEQGYEVAPSGQIPKAIMADYLDATSGGAA